MTMLNNPFAQLVDRAAHGRAERMARIDAATGTRTHQLLTIIAERGRCTTAELAADLDIPRNLVWGLLKYPRERGGLFFEAGHWQVVPNFPGADVLRAIKLLRDKGYSVRKIV